MTQLSTNSAESQAMQSGMGLDLAMTAAASERTNRSRAPIYLAGIVLIAAAIYALTGVMARTEASDRVAAQARNADATRRLADRFRAATDGQADARFAADPLMGSKIERLAESVGLKLSAPVAFVELPSVGGVAGMTQRKFTARASNADPAVLLEFLISSQDTGSYPGLDISNIVLRPSDTPGKPGTGPGNTDAIYDGGWNMQVDFSRWERRSG